MRSFFSHCHRPAQGSGLRHGYIEAFLLLAIACLLCFPIFAQEKGRGQGNHRPDSAKHIEKQRMESIRKSWLQEIHREESGARSKKKEAKKEAGEAGLYKQRPSQAKEQASPKKAGSLRLKDPGQAEAMTTKEERKLQGGEDSPPRAVDRQAALFSESPSFSSAILRFSFLICLLLGALYLCLRVWRYYVLHSRSPFAKGEDLVQLLLSIPLVQGKFLQIVDVAGQILVLGVSEAGVQLLMKLEEGIYVDRIRLWQSRQKAGVSQKGSWLGAMFGALQDRAGAKGKNTRHFSSFLENLLGQTAGAEPAYEDQEQKQRLEKLLQEQKKRIKKMTVQKQGSEKR